MIVHFQMKVTRPTGPATETPVEAVKEQRDGATKAEDPAGKALAEACEGKPLRRS